MKQEGPILWTLDELTSQVALALANDYNGAPSGRVRDVPDKRTVRYYTSIGLIDRPVAMRGRTALYGRRHLLQLVAIKQLQAKGLPLVEIQERLLGATDAALRKLARVPGDGEATTPRGTPRPDAGSFWRSAPAAPPSEADASLHVSLGEPEPGPQVLQGVPLGDEVILLLPAQRTIDDEDIEAARIVAAPLLQFLHRRRLLGPRHERI